MYIEKMLWKTPHFKIKFFILHRKRKEREERRARGEPEDSEEEDAAVNGDPFKRVDVNELAAKVCNVV